MEEQKQSTWLVIGVVILLIFSVIQFFSLISHKQAMSPQDQKSASAGAETYEEMMARMHPDQVRTASSQGQMVGGC